MWREIPAQGTPGKWIDRRIRYVQRGRRGEMLDLWRNMPEFPPLEGYSLTVLTPRTGEMPGQSVVIESTSASPELLGAKDFADPAAGLLFAMKVHALEMHACPIELLREVD